VKIHITSCRDHVLAEPGTKAPESLAIGLKDQTNIFPIQASVLRVVHEVGDVAVAEQSTVSVPHVRQDLSLIDFVIRAIVFGTGNFQGQKIPVNH